MTDTSRIAWIADHLHEGWLRVEVMWLIGQLRKAEAEADRLRLELRAIKDAMKEGDSEG